jgi:predicted lipoprotein with Yx(FWY)xxD motif
MSKAIKAVPCVLLCALIIAVPSVRAYWAQDGVALCTAAGDQSNPQIASDGAGGAIITWQDLRSGYNDIYAQRVNASGAVQWTVDGAAICTAMAYQYYPQITSDGAGGAIVTWFDLRNGNYDIYAQRVNSSGAVQWTADGVALCTATGNQMYPKIISDCAGGAIVTWYDLRSGINNDIYAQRVNASGAVQWTADGVALCTATGSQSNPQVTSDSVGGAIVTWFDLRNGNYDIYAQRVNSSGAVQWTADGVALCTATNEQTYQQTTSDGACGAIVTWIDYRSGSNYDIYAQRVNASGVVQWTANGVALCTATGSQYTPQITSDGAGGAIVTWHDYRSGSSYDIYAQRVNTSGAAQWTANGMALCTATGDQSNQQITSDDAGGAIVTWNDYRSGNNDIYAQRVNTSGAVQWAANGVALCTSTGDQTAPQITSDGTGGAIVTWNDYRGGNYDVYIQLIDRYGRVGAIGPEIYAVRDVPGDQGGNVYLSWYAARPDVFMDEAMLNYSIWRAISPAQATMALNEGAAALKSLSDLETASGKPVIRIEQAGALTYFWELVQTVDALSMEAYGKPVATLFDSTSVCHEYHYFQVVAHTTDPKVFWKSEPDSGYSVDNLAPCPPASLAGKQSFTPAGLNLTWDRNTEADLDGYRVYRGTSADFVPGSGNLVASPCDTTLLDTGWTWSAGYYYKVSALDAHENESSFALLAPDDLTGDDPPKAPEASYLAQNYPNPFNPSTRIAFGLSKPGHVSLNIYDVSGRLVRMLFEGDRPAGNFTELWDGRDAGGRTVASGIYFYRLTAGGFERTKKMALMR